MKLFYKILFTFVLIFGSFFVEENVKSLDESGLPTANSSSSSESSTDDSLCCMAKNSAGKVFACRGIVASQVSICNEESSTTQQDEIFSRWEDYGLSADDVASVDNISSGFCRESYKCRGKKIINSSFLWTLSPSSTKDININSNEFVEFTVTAIKNTNGILGGTGTPTIRCLNCNPKYTDILNITNSQNQASISIKFNVYKGIKDSNIIKFPFNTGYTFEVNDNLFASKKFIPLILKGTACSQRDRDTCDGVMCMWSDSINKCVSKANEKNCQNLTEDDCNKSTACTWSNKQCLIKSKASVDAYIKDRYGVPEGYEGPLPACSFDGSCRDINDLVDLVLNIINYLFSIVAGLAFIFFIYGGFTWIFSFGSPEKIKKGQQILVAAVVGLVIVFSAYILVDFLLDALNVSESFRGI